jgi:hypothetical protein
MPVRDWKKEPLFISDKGGQGGNRTSKKKWMVAQTNRLPFDRLRMNGNGLKSCGFPAHAELADT